jgi:RNA polymerase primary sigma factor
LEQKFQREPTDDEIADALDLNEGEISTTHMIRKHQLSFDAPLLNQEENGLNLYDVVHTDNIPSPDAGLLQESLKYEINNALYKLSKREGAIIEMSFGLNNTPVCTLVEIANKEGISTERVRQIKQSGIIKLRKYLVAKKSF